MLALAPSSEAERGRSLIFRAGGRVYTCAVEAVREVVPPGVMTRLPGAPSFVPGLINVRGTIVTVLDAGLYLHGRLYRPPGAIILIDMESRPVGLRVDTVIDVRPLRGEDRYEPLDVRAIAARVIMVTEEE